jgi:hypothetical protein
LDQIEKNDTWELVPRPKDKNVIGTKWVYMNKLNEYGQVTRNKDRLVCKGYAQVEGIDFEETFFLVSRMEAIRLLLAYACSKNIKVYQMDAKSVFLNGELEEEVYIEQPKGVQLSENADYVCKLKKALYGLKQAPRAWYLLAQGQAQGSTLQQRTNKTLTTNPFGNTCEADEVSPEVEAGVVAGLQCLQPYLGHNSVILFT